MAQDLRDKWILITGAASGIGKETSLLLAGEGSNLVLADINETGLVQTAEQLKALGAEVFYKATDVTDKEQIKELADAVHDRIGALDVLVNNAGFGCSAELKDTSDEQWEALIKLNFLSAINMVNAFLPPMLKKGRGQIVNISTGQVFYPVPTWGAYAASKAALATYSECLTWELRRFGIKVTTVFPGLINTPFYNEVETHTFPQKFVLWWIRSLGSTPLKMAIKIVGGIKKQKRRVIQSWVNWLNYLFRRHSPHAFDIVGDIFAQALGERCEF